ncbi:MAG: hypothetical protein IT493_16015 [Gammaproteobacteria bacterium]|nr:hypothetical protein [Gammaproteobacteria bacterium]
MNDEAQDLPTVIETTMQVIIALRWAVQRGAPLPAALDIASQDVLDALYAWQRHRGEYSPATPGSEPGKNRNSEKAGEHREGREGRAVA